jgi:hypothetical protein
MSESINGASAPSAAPVAESSQSQGNSNEIELDSQSHSSGGQDLPSAESIDADPSLSKAQKKEAKKLLKELELKYNGKVSKERLPFEIPEEHADWMRRQMQMAKMAQVKAQESSALERDVLEFFNELRQNPRKALSNPEFGVDIKKLAAEILEEELANAQKSPEQLERERLEIELRELREREKHRDEELRRIQEEKIVEQAAQEFDIQMSETLDKYNIPRTPLAIKKMAEYMSLAIQNQEHPDMEVIGQLVEEEMMTDYRDHLNSLPPERIVQLLGEEVFDKVRKDRVSKMKKGQPSVKALAKDTAQPKQKTEEKALKKQSFKDFFGV